jgi:hypothetical protein
MAVTARSSCQGCLQNSSANNQFITRSRRAPCAPSLGSVERQWCPPVAELAIQTWLSRCWRAAPAGTWRPSASHRALEESVARLRAHDEELACGGSTRDRALHRGDQGIGDQARGGSARWTSAILPTTSGLPQLTRRSPSTVSPSGSGQKGRGRADVGQVPIDFRGAARRPIRIHHPLCTAGH